MHIKVAHDFWKTILEEGDNVIDMTCGNGKDALFLTTIMQRGHLFCVDIQKEAIEKTKLLLSSNLRDMDRVHFLHMSHHLDLPIPMPIKLIVYNLGYLPKGDKSITTMTETTLMSIEKALELGKVLSITCYPGHEEGKREEEELIKFFSSLDPRKWSICYKQWINKPLSPTLFYCVKL